jgi:hypothetical protein
MAATKKQLNWSSVGFTPTAGSLIPFTGVQSVKITSGANFIRRSGDADRYPTTIVNDFNEPSMTISADDHIAMLTITPGSRGTVTATHKDAKLATGGNIVYSLANAVPGSPDLGGDHRQIGPASIQFWGESADGTTSPLSYTLT